MASFNSNQLARTSRLKQNETGKVRRLYFNGNTADYSGLAELDTIKLRRIPKNARLFGGKLFFEAMGTNQKADIGLKAFDDSGYIDAANTVADDPDFLTTTQIDVASAGQGDFGVLRVDNPGYETEKELYLTLTPEDSSSNVAWTTSMTFHGYIDIVVD